MRHLINLCTLIAIGSCTSIRSALKTMTGFEVNVLFSDAPDNQVIIYKEGNFKGESKVFEGE